MSGCLPMGNNGRRIYIEPLTEREQCLADKMDLPWRDARPSGPKRKCAPHKCRIERCVTKINGETVTLEIRK